MRNIKTNIQIILFALGAAIFLIPIENTSAADKTKKNQLGKEWDIRGKGEWIWTGEYTRMVKQNADAKSSTALNMALNGKYGAWRCFVEVSLGTQGAGLLFQTKADLSDGFLCTLGGNPGTGGLMLKRISKGREGKTLWSDKWVQWHIYEPYVLEGVIKEGKVRIQMFRWDKKTLLSQSPWIDVSKEETDYQGYIGLHTTKGIARFWGWEHDTTPLSPITPDAPNKRRLFQEDNTDWIIIGPGIWMWKSSKKRWIRQYAQVERSSAINLTMKGALTTWRCKIKVSPGAGGAGMLFQANNKRSDLLNTATVIRAGIPLQTKKDVDTGFLCWLGGKWGAGCLMLYQLPIKALWASPQDKWHYNTEYVLQAITQKGKVRVQQYQADGKTLIAESPWVAVPEEETTREGYIGFQTWKGMGEFSDFSKGTVLEARKGYEGKVTERPDRIVSSLGTTWVIFGKGNWKWADKNQRKILQTLKSKESSVITSSISGARGLWKCRIKIPNGTEGAGLLFQVDREMKEGFVCLMVSTPETTSLKLANVSGRMLWVNKQCKWKYDTEYILKGHVETDRVRVQLCTSDGRTVIAESSPIYVSEKNNHRLGYIGFTTRGGPAEFSDFSFESK